MIHVLALLALAAVSPQSPVVGLVDEPKFGPNQARVEIVSRGPSGVKATAADGTWWWLRWLDEGQDAALVMLPVREAKPGTLTWRGERRGGMDRLSFRVVWPGTCPCILEVTSNGRAAMAWRGVEGE